MSGSDTAFVLICAALVLFMTPGLAFFYGGLGRRKNVANNIMASFFIVGLEIVMWMVFGFTLAFGSDHGGIIGGFDYLLMGGVGSNAGPYAATIPFMAYALFQMMFAIITPALITGAIAGRMRFKALFLFILLWTIVVYYPIAHMVWGQGGILAAIGSVDFAGGNVVHISSGVSALVLCICLGRRAGYDQVNYRVHNIPLVAIGATLLLFGWFGFNAGSALAADGLAVHAFATTALSAASAELAWMLMDALTDGGKPTLVGACTGLVIGLVAITPGCGYVPLWAAIIIGGLASPICYFAVSVIKPKFGYDDALDAFGCHGVGGIWGGIATGLFASKQVNPALGFDGLVFGDVRLLGAQLVAILVTIALAVVGTLVCVAIVKLCVGSLRVSVHEEHMGLDISQHGERAYPSFNGLDD
ncbi:MAG: ammonium transporter [Coriobacteriales bacterium]|nr:ammonium transporter [Coriobacteriales bacterium]